jgi:hypothetical protein
MEKEKIAIYRSPGPHFGPPGNTYDSKGVTPEDLPQAIAEGWSESYLAALGMKPEPDPALSGDNAPATRAEMEQQAALLGIDVDGRWSDKTLLANIHAAMNAANPV